MLPRGELFSVTARDVVRAAAGAVAAYLLIKLYRAWKVGDEAIQ